MEEMWWFIIGIVIALVLLIVVAVVFQNVSLCKFMGWDEARCGSLIKK